MNYRKIINIMPDDKFLDYFIEMSEHYTPNISEYFILSNSSKLRHVKSDKVKILRDNESSLNAILNHLDNSSAIIFHSFKPKQYNFILKLPKPLIKIWIFWGHEGYNVFPSSKFINYQTYLSQYNSNLFSQLKANASWIKNRIFCNNPETKNIIKQFDLCATWVDNDFFLAKKINPNIRKIYFNYYTKELMHFNILINPPSTSENQIFLGNSANPTNNHLEALKYLKQINYKGNIVCSLSYSGSKLYVKNIIKIGYTLFGERFIPLTNFLSLNEYQSIINNSNIVWMNHKRQQAAGNLFTAFASSKIVILHPKNPMITTFKKWNLTFYTKGILKNLKTINHQKLLKNQSIILDKVNINENNSFFNFLNKL